MKIRHYVRRVILLSNFVDSIMDKIVKLFKRLVKNGISPKFAFLKILNHYGFHGESYSDIRYRKQFIDNFKKYGITLPMLLALKLPRNQMSSWLYRKYKDNLKFNYPM